MLSKRNTVLILILIILVSSFSYGQAVLKLKAYDGTPSSTLIAQIKADTAANKGILKTDRVYELEAGGMYITTEIFNVAKGLTVRLKATGKKPIIYLYPTGTGSTPLRPPGNLFVLLGGNLEMTNVAVSGYFEPDQSNFDNVQGGLINTTGEGSSITIDNCLLTNINGQHIRTGSAAKNVKVTNSIFANMGALSTSNFGAGKGLDLREVSVDTLILTNNTFVNYQDRVVRHYNVTSPLTVGGIKYVNIDHNTFLNGMGFHGLLSLGALGGVANITNNLFLNAFAAGEDSTDGTRAAEWANTGEKYPSGKNRIMWIFNTPDQTTQWTIKNNYFSISDAGQAFFDAHKKEPIVEGSPLSWHINKRIGADSTKAFTKEKITMLKTPRLMTNLMEWYISPTGGNKTKNTPSSLWVRSRDDYDRRVYSYFLDTMNCKYQTTAKAYTGADKGLPVGALTWWGISAVEKTEVIPTSFSLEQNYPNPFNPSTKIVYSLPKDSHVRLEIFDMLGRKVATLVNEQQQVGQYKVDFDGSKLSSGVYVYQLSSSSQIISKKMMLIK